MSSSQTLSVVVVAYRQREPLVNCLRALGLAAQELQRSDQNEISAVELIVVDNGDLSELISEASPDALLLKPDSNLGFAGGAQLGIEAASGEWIALVNDDATVEPDALRWLVQAGERDQRIGSVAAQVRFEGDRDRVNSAGIEVDSLGLATERLAGRPIADAEEPREVFGASACVALYRTSMLRELTGLDTRFFAYLEDVDLAWRARAAGWSAVYEPRAIAYHRGSASSGEGSATKYFLVGRNRVRLLARNATTRQLGLLWPAIVLYDLAYITYTALTDRNLAALHGRIAGLREWRSLRREGRAWRREVALCSPWTGWIQSLRQHLAYRRAAGTGRGGL